jgi:hypothetical protein
MRCDTPHDLQNRVEGLGIPPNHPQEGHKSDQPWKQRQDAAIRQGGGEIRDPVGSVLVKRPPADSSLRPVRKIAKCAGFRRRAVDRA